MESLLLTFTFHLWDVLAQTLIFGVLLTLAIRALLAMLAPLTAATRYVAWFATLVTIALFPAALLVRTTLPTVRQVLSPATPPRVKTVAVHQARKAALPTASVNPVPAAPEVRKPDVAHVVFLPAEFAAGALAAAAGIILLLFSRLGVSYLRLRRLKASAFPAPADIQAHFDTWMADCPSRRPTRLLLSAEVHSPMAVGFRTPAVIIPELLLLQLTTDEFRHLSLHELAHVRRCDDWTNLIQRTLQACLFFHPAVHWLCRRLEFEREVACDDHVLALAPSAQPYARCLAKVLECTPWRRGPVLASGALFRKPRILRRTELLFDTARDASPRVSATAVVVVLMCGFGALSEFADVPALLTFANLPDGSHQRSTWVIDGRKIQFEQHGDIEFGDDDMSVQSLSPGSFLRVREGGWNRRELEIRRGESAGDVVVRYRVNDRERPLDAQGKAWAASTLTFIVRETGLNAEERAMRIFDKRGAAGVLEEIDRIHSDHSRVQYLAAVIGSAKLGQEDLRRAMSRAGRVSSDHDKANLLLSVADTYNSEPLRSAWFDAVNTIHSDHDLRRVLTLAMEEAGSDSSVLVHAGRSIGHMSSDHDKSELLRAAAAGKADLSDAVARRALLGAAVTIQSDHEKANVLTEMLGSGVLPAEAVKEVLHVAGTIHSDNDRGRVLNTVIGRDLEAGVVEELSGTIERMGSDSEKANALIRLAAKPPTPAFLKAALSIASDHDKRRVIEAMLDRNSAPEAARDAAALAVTIGSDHDKAEVLSAIADKFRADPMVRDQVRKAAQKIASDSDYRKIASKLLIDSSENGPKDRD